MESIIQDVIDNQTVEVGPTDRAGGVARKKKGKGQNEQQEATAGPQVSCGDAPASCSQVRGARTGVSGHGGWDQKRSAKIGCYVRDGT